MKQIILYNIAFLVFWALFSLGLYAHGTLDHPVFFSNWVVMNIFFGAALVVEVVIIAGSWLIERTEED